MAVISKEGRVCEIRYLQGSGLPPQQTVYAQGRCMLHPELTKASNVEDEES